MDIYYNGEQYAVTHGTLVLFGKSLIESETQSKIFYSENAMKRFFIENGYQKIRNVSELEHALPAGQ